MEVVWLKKALENLNDEATFLNSIDSNLAKRFIEQVKIQVNQLREFPASGKHGRVIGTRELVINTFPYIIPYRVFNNQIQILRVFHTSRKLPNKW